MAGELITRLPPVALRGLVRTFHGYTERTEAPMRRRELPGGRAVLIVGLGPPLGVQNDGRPAQRLVSFAAGLHTAPAFTSHSGEMAGVQVMLTPLGARALLGVPMHELTGLTVPLEDLLGAAAAELAERASLATTWDERFAIVQECLMRLADRVPGPAPEMSWAYGQLRRRPVRAIATELGWSQRRLRAAFLDGVGLRPKTVARLQRFEDAIGLLRRGLALADTAHTAGYADQAHMSREVRELAGATPATLLAEGLVTDPMRSDHFVQDERVAAA